MMIDVNSHSNLIARYRQYLAHCNARRWEQLSWCVADRVQVNDRARSRVQYVDDIRAITEVFPDYRWELRRFVVENDWLAVHLHATGTRAGAFLHAPGDGSPVETEEFAMYRFTDGLIVEVEGTADNARLAR